MRVKPEQLTFNNGSLSLKLGDSVYLYMYPLMNMRGHTGVDLDDALFDCVACFYPFVKGEKYNIDLRYWQKIS